MCNVELLKTAKEKRVTFWEIAMELGISEPTMTRRLRFELSETEKQKFMSIIDKLSAGKEIK